MTETEWKALNDPDPMIRARHPDRHQRELRLFGARCVRRIWALLPLECQRAVDMAERLPLGEISATDLAPAFDSASRAADDVGSGGRSPDALAYAANAAVDAASSHRRTAATVLSAAGNAASAAACAAAEAAAAADNDYDAAFDAARQREVEAQAALLRDLVPHPPRREVTGRARKQCVRRRRRRPAAAAAAAALSAQGSTG